MNSNEKKLLKYLYSKNEWRTSNELATHLGVSIRNIKYSIKRINYEILCIEASKKGYRIIEDKKELVKNIIEDNNDEIISSEERQQYILNALFTRENGVDVYDLADELSVSDSTVRQDLSKIREYLDKHMLALQLIEDKYLLIGNEKAKRQVMSEILSKEVNNGKLLENVVGSIVDYDKYKLLSKLLKEKLVEHNYFVTDFALLNLMIHLIVIIDRVSKNESIVEEKISKTEYPISREFKIASELFNEYSNILNLNFTDSEVLSYSLLLESMTLPANYLEVKDKKRIEEICGKDIVELVDKIISRVNSQYHIDISESNFYIKFALHIKNLVARVKDNKSNKNPYIENIKFSYPLIYEVSVFIADCIYEETGYHINDDEITYLAMHLACVFEDNVKQSRIQAVLICPSYYSLAEETAKKINEQFMGILNIVRIVTEEVDSLESYDLIISTIELRGNYNNETILISPILSGKDIYHIRELISKIEGNKKNKEINDFLLPLFSKDLFFTDTDFKTNDDVIKILCDKLKDKSFVDDDYYSNVLKREEMSSTIFNKIAIPHSLKPCAKKSGIAICIFNKPQKIFNKGVNIVLLLAISNDDQLLFNNVFTKITEIMLSESSYKLISKCKTYDEFINVLKAGVL